MRWLGVAAHVVATWTVILAVVLGLGWLITGPLQSTVDAWDNGVVRWFVGERVPDLNTAADDASFLGKTVVGVVVAAVVALALSVALRSVRPVAFFVLVFAGIRGFYWVTTELITRPRPPVPILDPDTVPDASFPSGHLATAVAVYGGTALLVWRLTPRGRRGWVWLLLLVPLSVALARLYQGAHHPTDELASIFYTTAWLAVCGHVLLRRPDQ